MTEPRIKPAQTAALKEWMAENKAQLLLGGIDLIDAHYTDDDLSIGAFDEFHAYTVTNFGSTFTEVPLTVSGKLKLLLEELAQNDDFFPGQEGGGGTIRLLIEPGLIEHLSFESVTTKLEHEIETY